MIKLKGTKIETEEFIVDVSDKELMRAIKERTGVHGFILNDNKDEIGYWRDESSDRSNFEDWQWRCISTDKEGIKVLKAINIIEEYINKVEK